MLRIGPVKNAVPAPQDVPPPVAPEAPVPVDQGPDDPKGPSDPSQKFDAEKVDPSIARYLGPKDRCGSCSFFNPDNTCQIVAGSIEPEGTCSLFTPMESGPKDDPIAPPDEPLPSPIDEGEANAQVPA